VKLDRINIVTVLLVVAGLISLGWWLAKDPVRDFVTSEPGLDNRGAGAVVPDIDILPLRVTLQKHGPVSGESISTISAGPPSRSSINFLKGVR
jgi:hypothetical protein